jgi:hypothetical protein
MTTKAMLLKSIRVKCLDCSCYQPGEVQKCPVQTCDLWLYRFRRDPTPSQRGFRKIPSPSRAVLSGKGLSRVPVRALG